MIRTLEGHTDQITALMYIKEKNILASGCRDKTIKLWDVKEGKLIKTLEGHTSGVEALAYMKESDYLASSSMDKTIIIWDMKDKTLLDELL